MTDRPNIHRFTTDRQRFDTIGALGNPAVSTLTLDKIAEGGRAFAEWLPFL